jgi:hypothetical protein
MQEPPKSDDNKIRIKFEDGVYSISKEDKIAVDSMLKLMGDNEELSFKIKSYTSSEIDADKSISQSVIRLQKLMKYLSTKNISFEKTKLYTYSSDQNEYDINYIDIDKL